MKKKLRIKPIHLGIILFLILCMVIMVHLNIWKLELSFETSSGLSDVLEVHYIDVGQGDSILIEGAGAAMLIDAGDNSEGDVVADYLKAENIKDLDYVIATHPHSDHVGGLDTILNSVPVDQIIMPSVTYESNTYEDVLDAIELNNIPESTAKVGDRYRLGDATFTILASGSGDYEDPNNESVCIKLTYKHTSFLFTGDAETLSEKEMLKSGIDLSADVIKIGHHGSASSSSVAFLEAVQPEYAVISVGEDNIYDLPRSSVLQRLVDYDIDLFRTDKQGTIIITSDGEDITVNQQPYDITSSDLKVDKN